MIYNYAYFFPLIHLHVYIIKSPIVLMTLNNGLFLIIFFLMIQNEIVEFFNFSPPIYFPIFSIDNIVILYASYCIQLKCIL